MLDGKRVTVAGLGMSGLSAAAFLREKGALVRITENNDNKEIRERIVSLNEKGIECEIGGHSEDFLNGTELLVVSPGLENSSLPIKWAENKNIPVMSEIELAYRFCKGPILAISGTNGKSTVTTIAGEMLKKAQKKVCVCGNIGLPFTSAVSTVDEDTIVVLEISSFQLERIQEFRPRVAVMLNITEDHLDRHKDFDEYANAKMRIFANQNKNDYALLNYEQARFRKLKGALSSGMLYFSKCSLPSGFEGAFMENNELVIRKDSRYVWIGNKDALSLTGEHNIENALAAGLSSFLFGVDAEIIKDVLYSFKGLSHRCETVDTIDGIRFVDDSKATNIDSARRAVQSSPKGIILIAGGRDKGGDYRILKKLFKEKVRMAILIGEAKEKIADALSDTVPVSFADSLGQAVKEAFEKSKRGNTVLLSPMCSSFDMFKDYKERGEEFRRAVKGLKEDA